MQTAAQTTMTREERLRIRREVEAAKDLASSESAEVRRHAWKVLGLLGALLGVRAEEFEDGPCDQLFVGKLDEVLRD